jgi:O-antigen ligase
MFDSNHFAQGLVMLLPPALYLAWMERSRWLKAASGLAVVGMAEVIILTFSRGGLLSLICVLGGAAALQRRVPLRSLSVFGLVGMLIFLAPWQYQGRLALTGEFIADRVSRLLQQPSPASATAATPTRAVSPTGPSVADVAASPVAASRADPSVAAAAPSPAVGRVGRSPEQEAAYAEEARFGSLDERSRAWRVAARITREHPVFGVGLRNYYLAYPSAAPQADPGMNSFPRGAHNSPIQVAAETGLVGLATWSYAILVGLLGALEARRLLAERGDADSAALLEALLLGALGFLLAAMFLNANFFRHLWLVLALAAAGRRIARLAPPGAAVGSQLAAS